MVYKAIKEIGGYQPGQVVPTEKALIWLNMYDVPHVELVSGDEPVEEKEVIVESNDDLLDNYLDQNAYSVKKAIKEDDLTDDQLEKLIELEENDKNRKVIIKALKSKLE